MFDAVPARPEDFEALFALHVASMREYVTATYGWDDAVQRRLFAEDWPKNRDQLRVIWRDGQIAASFRVERRPKELHLASIEVAPELHGQGLGSSIVEGLLAEGRALGVPVSLAVMKANPRARALYSRLGFVVVREIATHCLMRAN